MSVMRFVCFLSDTFVGLVPTLQRLPDECIFYILNMCRWDWFEDDAEEMSQIRRRLSGMRSILPSSSRPRRQSRPTSERTAVEVEEPRRRFRIFGFGGMRNALTASS